VATASATLTGLLFVSPSLQRQEDKPDLAKLLLKGARRSFGDFLYVLMLALVFLVPRRSQGGLAIALFALGASRAIGLIRQAARRRPPGGKRLPLLGTLRGIALPAVANLGLLVVAMEVVRGEFVSLFGRVLVIAALLTTGSWHAWMLLVEPPVRDDKLGRAGSSVTSLGRGRVARRFVRIPLRLVWTSGSSEDLPRDGEARAPRTRQRFADVRGILTYRKGPMAWPPM
jgi:hypothetical protein